MNHNQKMLLIGLAGVGILIAINLVNKTENGVTSFIKEYGSYAAAITDKSNCGCNKAKIY